MRPVHAAFSFPGAPLRPASPPCHAPVVPSTLAPPPAGPLALRSRRVRTCRRAPLRASASDRHSGAPSPGEESAPPTPPSSPAPSSPVLSALSRLSNVITTLFPVWTVVASVVALRWPARFAALTAPAVIQTSLSLLMLSMGLTLRPSELLRAAQRPAPLAFNFASCYALMPALALLLSRAFGLQGAARAGLLLLSIVSGGQASNLCTHIAGGDVALSVTLTTATTLAAAAALPALSAALLGTAVPVDAAALAASTARVTLAPLAVGAATARVAPRAVAKIDKLLPAAAVAAVVVLVLGPVAKSAAGLNAAAWSALLAPVVLLHVIGGLAGFVVPWLAGAGWRAALTMAFETGFKSPALSFVLASKCFPPGVELASAVSIVVLAPLAAVCAVLVRTLTKGGKGEGAA